VAESLSQHFRKVRRQAEVIVTEILMAETSNVEMYQLALRKANMQMPLTPRRAPSEVLELNCNATYKVQGVGHTVVASDSVMGSAV
jgi:hypothetical protein